MRLRRNTGLTTNRAPARITVSAVCGVEDGASTDQDTRRQRRREFLDERHGSRHRHRDLECANAAFDQRVGDRAQLRAVGQADDRDDAGVLDLTNDGASGPSIIRTAPAIR